MSWTQVSTGSSRPPSSHGRRTSRASPAPAPRATARAPAVRLAGTWSRPGPHTLAGGHVKGAAFGKEPSTLKSLKSIILHPSNPTPRQRHEHTATQKQRSPRSRARFFKQAKMEKIQTCPDHRWHMDMKSGTPTERTAVLTRATVRTTLSVLAK